MANIALKQFKNNEKLKASEVYYDTAHSILDIIFPIGRGFIDFTNTDYSNYLGFTWKRELVGLTPVGLDTSQTEFNTIGKTGGEKVHTLTVSEIPNGYRLVVPKGNEYAVQDYILHDEVQPHNNLQPYKVVAYWKRVA